MAQQQKGSAESVQGNPHLDRVRYPLGPYFGEYNEAGVDLSLLRYMLSLSPLERLVRMEQHARDTLTLYEYGRKHRAAKTAENR
jgi:hypothetical protein